MCPRLPRPLSHRERGFAISRPSASSPRRHESVRGVGRNWNKRGFSGSWLTKRLFSEGKGALAAGNAGPAGDSRWNAKRGKIRLNPDPLLPPARHCLVPSTRGWGGSGGGEGKQKGKNPPRNTKQNTRRGTTSSLWPRGCALGQGQVPWGERGQPDVAPPARGAQVTARCSPRQTISWQTF